MLASELIKKYAMETHAEKGLFIETHYPCDGGERPTSGSIYYYVAPGEITGFHRIDCDEYWIYNAGCTLEICVVTTDGRVEIRRCGIDEDAEPKVYMEKGEIFASRLSKEAEDGCFVTCITVPRFDYSGFELMDSAALGEIYPEIREFTGND